MLGYHDHSRIDGGQARSIRHCLVTPGDVREHQPFRDQFRRVLFRRKLCPKRVIADTTYGTVENLQAIEGADIRLDTPLPDWEKSSPDFRSAQFTDDAEHDVDHCPRGEILPFRSTDTTNERKLDRAHASICKTCPLQAQCTSNRQGRVIYRSFHADLLERVRTRHPSFREGHASTQGLGRAHVAEAKQWHGLSRFRLRGVRNVNLAGVLIATGQHLKRNVAARGWGRRRGPSGWLTSPALTLVNLLTSR